MSKYKDLIRASKPESQQTSLPEDEIVNLSIKVPKRLRQHWVAEAKREGSSLTAEIIRMLTEKYGEP